MRNIVILALAMLAISAAASAQTGTYLLNDTWIVARDFPLWQTESVDTTTKTAGTNSLKIDSGLCEGMTGNIAVWLTTDAATKVLCSTISYPNICTMSFCYKLGGGVYNPNPAAGPGTMTFQTKILNNAYGDSGASTGTLQSWDVTMAADNKWHHVVLSFTDWVNKPGPNDALETIELYHQDWGGYGVGDGVNDVFLNVDNFQFSQYVPCACGAYKGDFNNDSQVNDADYTVWADNYGKNPQMNGRPTYQTGSGPGGTINDADYTKWADNYGKLTPAPEPASLSLLLLGGLAMLRCRGRAMH